MKNTLQKLNPKSSSSNNAIERGLRESVWPECCDERVRDRERRGRSNAIEQQQQQRVRE